MMFSKNYNSEKLAKQRLIRAFQASRFLKMCKIYEELKQKDVKYCKSGIKEFIDAIESLT